MKKTLNELFDKATPEDLDSFPDALSAPDLPPETLSAVKEKVYAKTGLKPGKKSRKRMWYRFGVIAACLALIMSAVLLVPMLRGDRPPAIPVWEDARYSAADIAILFDVPKDAAASTNAYTKVYVPDTQYLYINPLPEDDYLGVYQYHAEKKALDKEEFRTFLDGILPKLASAVDADIPFYEIKEKDTYEKRLEFHEYTGRYLMMADQNERYTRFHLSVQWEYSNRKITLSGEPVQVDQRLSDDEIISSLQPIKSILFDLFGVSFPNVKILRSFNSYSEHGASWIEIYFYDENAHALNRTQERPVSDYIVIKFDNAKNYADDIVSDSVLHVASIDYYQYRTDVSKIYSLAANAKNRSLEDAEALLYNGYVFGGHSCPLCMAAQDKISFEGYDFVGQEYVFGYDSKADQPTTGIPFYVFYKNIGNSENGNAIYAKTYVPAIEIMGLEAYFQSQAKEHKTGDSDPVD